MREEGRGDRRDGGNLDGESRRVAEVVVVVEEEKSGEKKEREKTREGSEGGNLVRILILLKAR